ncbi:hypothetical protein [Crossiella cryophila]|uniref:Uncharacterized protein n=1 Tax=Crossiella cryophila TaxID=43355 RepID=A0A7W7CJK8_9PSEU|nr:hypothetical protein [Crossiella cryophila]MBB4682424.1 hypothetical protein [Crossiella cryophila]
MIDVERTRDWRTLVVNGTEPGQGGRTDSRTMRAAIGVVFRVLREQPGDWAWTAELF